MIHIITDSTCELDQEAGERLGITVVPLKVLFGTEEYADGVDLTSELFYQKLEEAEELPTTTQVNPNTFKTIFESCLQGEDEVIAILLSSKLSGTYQSAVIAKEMIGSEKIHIVDSQNVTLGLALLVAEAAKLRDDGFTADEILEKVEKLKEKVHVISAIDTLKYLQKGGRISAATALVGAALGIKPIIEVRDGLVQMRDKVRGQKKIQKYLIDYMKTHKPNTAHHVVFAHSMAKEWLAESINVISEHIEIKENFTVCLGSTVGVHVGPGGIGAAFIEE